MVEIPKDIIYFINYFITLTITYLFTLLVFHAYFKHQRL